MDRTAEFRAFVAQLPKPPLPPQDAQAGSQSNGGKTKAQITAAFLASFHGSAAVISKKIYDTSSKLSRLSKLVQRKSMFDDPVDEINSLMYAIKEDIQTLNTMVDGTQRDVDDFKYKGNEHGQLASHSSHVVTTLRGDLAETTRKFKTLLQERSTNVKEQFDRRGQYGIRTTDNVLTLGKPAVYRPMTLPAPPSNGVSGHTHTGSGGGSSGQISSGGGSSVGGGIGDGGSGTRSRASSLPRPAGVDAPMATGGGMQVTRYQQQQQLIPEQGYLEARAQAIEDVETHIVELGQIFNRLAHMIHEQRELVERIEDNVDDAHERVSRTRDYLMSVYSRLSSNRPLILKSMLVLILFVVFFVLFLA